jgi:AcrR family transcriptional regulator
MARILKLDEHAARRNDILDAALGLVMTKGYERMSVGDILTLMGISSGAFYHYFDSKPAVLEAIVQRIREGSEPPLRLVFEDPELTAIEKLQTFFDVLDTIRNERKGEVIELLRVWYSDDNAIVRSKVETATYGWRAGLITRIAEQGAAEGTMAPEHLERSGEIVTALMHAMADAHAATMLDYGHKRIDEAAFTAAMIATHAAYLDAIERVLGLPTNSLRRSDADAVAKWGRLLKS